MAELVGTVNPVVRKNSPANKFCTQPTQVIGVQNETPITWSPDGQFLAFVSGNHSIYVLTQASGRYVVHRLLNGHNHAVKALAFHPE